MVAHSKFLEVENVGEVTVVKFVGKKIIYEQNVQEISELLFSLVDDSKGTKILIDLGDVEYLTSAFLAIFITLHRKLSMVKGKLAIHCPAESLVREKLRITKLDKVLSIFENREDALKALQP